MSLPTTKLAETFLNVVQNVAIPCDWPVYADDEIDVIYGSASVKATLNTHYTVALSPPNFDQFTITPLPALLTLINNLITADPTNEINYLTVRRTLDNLTSVQPETVRGVAFLSREIDRLWMGIQQVTEAGLRCLQYPRKEVGGVDATVILPGKEQRALKALVFDEDGNATVSEDDYNDQAEDAAASAAAALANRILTDANVATTDANVAITDANVVTTNADVVATQAAAAQAAASAAEGMYNNVVAKSFADSPMVPPAAEEGTLYRIDCTGGNVIVNLSTLATYAEDMKFGFVKVDGTANTITVNRGGGDTINGATNIIISQQWETHALVGDLATGTWVDVVQAAVIPNNSLSLAKLAQAAANTILGNFTGALANVTALALGANTILGRSSAGNAVAKAFSDLAFTFNARATAALMRDDILAAGRSQVDWMTVTIKAPVNGDFAVFNQVAPLGYTITKLSGYTTGSGTATATLKVSGTGTTIATLGLTTTPGNTTSMANNVNPTGFYVELSSVATNPAFVIVEVELTRVMS